MKKIWKRMTAMIVAVLMVVAMLPATAWAVTVEDTGSLTIVKHGDKKEEVLAGAVFSVYQVASISVADNVFTYQVNEAYAGVLGDVSGNLNDLNPSVWEESVTALAAVNTSASAVSSATDTSGITTISDLPLGIYLVKETTAPQGYMASTPFLVSIPSTNNYSSGAEGSDYVYDITAEPKNESQTVDKVVDSEPSVGIGDEVDYKVTTQIPTYGAEYTNPTFIIYDTMTDGLTFDAESPLVVTVDGSTVEAGADTFQVNYGTNNRTFEIVFDADYIMEHKGQSVVVTYTAVVNKDAVYKNGNEAGITYNNEPGSTTDADSGEKDVYTYTIDLTKIGEGKDANGLNGASFTLQKEGEDSITVVVNGTETTVTGDKELATATYNEVDGKLVFHGLSEGTYTLKEVKTPSGYSLLANPITIVITAAEDGTLTSATVDGEEVSSNNGTISVTVENHKGFSLPETGGMGTYLFTIGGLAIMVGAVALLVASKRKRNA